MDNRICEEDPIAEGVDMISRLGAESDIESFDMAFFKVSPEEVKSTKIESPWSESIGSEIIVRQQKTCIRPESERPRLCEVEECNDVPVIDLGCQDRSLVIKQIGDACRDYGFFQVINYGVSKERMDKMQWVAHEFDLPVDYLRLHCYPLEKYVAEWPSKPSSLEDDVSSYRMEVQQLGLRLEEAISESLGLHKDEIRNVLGEQGQHMAVNYYPACPEPELTYGLPAHMDPNALAILLQDLKVSGLQVLKDGKWLEIKPHPDAFVFNIGDQIQAAESSPGSRKHGCPCDHHCIVVIQEPEGGTTINSPEDDKGLEFRHSGLMATVAAQAVAGALANRIASSNANSSTVSGVHFMEVAIVLALAFKLAALAAQRRLKKLSVWLAKIGDMLTASAVILSLALYLPPLMASIAGLLAFLIVATAVAFA